ncbi:MAG: hypothetical protein B6240_14745 [Desulfobacteraceae bacterium 4572_87]|nr:MAG: hypothetical protein B6240_14745 [Desulfobacteraceae bacterium 4572_87]
MKKTLKKFDLNGIREIQKFLRNSEEVMSEATLMDAILHRDFPAVRDKTGASWQADSRAVKGWLVAQDAPQRAVLRTMPGVTIEGMGAICEEFKVSSLDVLQWFRHKERTGCPVQRDLKTQTFNVDFDQMEKWNINRKETLENAA